MKRIRFDTVTAPQMPAIAHAFMVYGLLCVVVAGIWGAVTVSKRILFIQALPAALALIAFYLVKT